ncbi:unnamed protein product [Blepharisma stoltei]|uniref:CHCH domain-containing protein n=1 Tax=Blepharisma stoltei TaxID=1481888 RepID=A0AAU9J6G1_9CILI|nr:unnamed protein product [Blepharisma stoltei]
MGIPTIPLIVVFTGTLLIGFGYWKSVLYGFFYPEKKAETLRKLALREFKSNNGNYYAFPKSELPENCIHYLNQLNQCLKLSKSESSMCQIYVDDLFECRERFL